MLNTCTQTILSSTVDDQAPTVLCPADVQHTALTGQGGSNMEWNEPQAFDNSGTADLISRSHTPGSFFPMGATTVSYTFADPSGNTASCSFDVIVSEGQ